MRFREPECWCGAAAVVRDDASVWTCKAHYQGEPIVPFRHGSQPIRRMRLVQAEPGKLESLREEAALMAAEGGRRLEAEVRRVRLRLFRLRLRAGLRRWRRRLMAWPLRLIQVVRNITKR